VVARNADTLYEQPTASQRGRHREDRRLDREMGMDQPGPGGRARRADRRSRQWSPPRRGGSQIHPGDCRARLQRGGEQAYRLADNELAARGSWDLDLLRSELGDLKFSGFDLDLIGFEPDRLDEILRGLGSSGLSDPDSVPDVLDQPVTRPGDIWRLGDHCAGCGDSTNAADVELVLAGAQPQLMVSDPSYGVGYDPSWRALF